MTQLASPPRRQQIVMGRAYLPVLHNTDDFIFCESPRGCLKTCSFLNILMIRGTKYRGLRWYLWRSTRTLLSTTVMRSMDDYIIPLWHNVPGKRLMNPKPDPANRNAYLFEDGTEIIPVGLDDVLRGTSAEGAGGYLAEAIELEVKERATALAGMMRQPGIPYRQIIVDANPGAPGHWLNQLAEPIDNKLRNVQTREDYERLQAYNCLPRQDKSRWKRIVAKIQDNPYYFDVEKWANKEDGEDYLRKLRASFQSGHMFARWVLGEWQAAEGGVFPDFSESRNICDPFPGGWPREWPVWIGYDSGYRHPAAVVFYGLAPNGQPFIFDEIYQSGLALDELGRKIIDRTDGLNVVRWLADPRDVFKKTAHASGKTIAEYMRETFEIQFEPWPPKQGPIVHNQVEAVRNLIRDVKPLQVWRTCTNTIGEFQSWSYKTMADGSMPAGDDAFEDKNNDAMDAVLGIVATNPTFSQPTVEVHNND